MVLESQSVNKSQIISQEMILKQNERQDRTATPGIQPNASGAATVSPDGKQD